MPDKTRDGQNGALKFLSDCWRARSSKAEFLHVYTMSYIFVNLPDRVRCNVRQVVHFLTCVNVQLFSLSYKFFVVAVLRSNAIWHLEQELQCPSVRAPRLTKKNCIVSGSACCAH